MFRAGFGAPIAIALTISTGIQLDTFRLQHTEPFYYRSITALTPQVRRGENFVQQVDVERFRICDVKIIRFMVHEQAGLLLPRIEEPGGASPLGRKPAKIPVTVPMDAPNGKVCMIQRSSSHCIDGMHSTPWPDVCFEVVD